MTIDIMHNLYSGVLAHHTTAVWGMDSELPDGLDGITHDPSKRQASVKELTSARRILQYEALQELRKLPKHILRQLCKEQGLRFSGRAGKLFKRLHQLELFVREPTVLVRRGAFEKA